MKALTFALTLLTTTACAEAHFFGHNGRLPGHAPHHDDDPGDDDQTPPQGPGQDAVPSDVAPAAAPRVVVLVDVSDRMGPHQLPPPSQEQTQTGGTTPGLDPLVQASCARRDAALALVAKYAGSDTTVTVLPFAAKAEAAVTELTAEQLCAARSGEGANTAAALTRARDLLAAAQGSATVVLVTAGEPTLPEGGAWPATETAAAALRALPATLELAAVGPMTNATRERYTAIFTP